MGELARLPSLPPEQCAFPFPEIFPSPSREKFQAPATKMDTGDMTTAVCGALRRAFDGTDSPVKRIARLANCNARTAEGWYQGKNMPDAVHLLRLMAQVPELAGEVRRLTGMEADVDPEFGQAFMQAMRAFSKLQGAR